MSWTKEHDLILCREVVNLNPFTTRKGSTQRSSMWEQIADTLNKCHSLKFYVDKRSVRDHVGILVNRHKKKLRDEENASGITPDEPNELDLALESIIALEESADAEVHEADAAKKEKVESDRAKAEGVRTKAMEKLSETRKRESTDASEDNSKRQRRRGSDAMQYLSQKADLNYELKQEELKMKKQQQEFEKKQMEASHQQQLHIQQQQTEMLRMMHQQQQQSQQQFINSQMLMMQQQEQQTKALMTLLEKVINK